MFNRMYNFFCSKQSRIEEPKIKRHKEQTIDAVKNIISQVQNLNSSIDNSALFYTLLVEFGIFFLGEFLKKLPALYKSSMERDLTENEASFFEGLHIYSLIPMCFMAIGSPIYIYLKLWQSKLNEYDEIHKTKLVPVLEKIKANNPGILPENVDFSLIGLSKLMWDVQTQVLHQLEKPRALRV